MSAPRTQNKECKSEPNKLQIAPKQGKKEKMRNNYFARDIEKNWTKKIKNISYCMAPFTDMNKMRRRNVKKKFFW